MLFMLYKDPNGIKLFQIKLFGLSVYGSPRFIYHYLNLQYIYLVPYITLCTVENNVQLERFSAFAVFGLRG